jgi:hypothetical protein
MGPFSEMMLEGASLWGDVANWTLLICLVGGVLATFGIVQTTNVKEHHWDVAREKSAERIKELESESLRAKADFETAKADIASANAVSAQANERAAEAQLALERFKAPRSIPTNERPQMIANLRGFGGTKVAVYVIGDSPEPTSLGASINALLNDAQWVSLMWQWSGGGSATGVIVMLKEGSDQTIEAAASSIASALHSAQINSGKQYWPGDWNSFGGMLNGPNPPAPTEAPIRVVIGSKPQ